MRLYTLAVALIILSAVSASAADWSRSFIDPLMTVAMAKKPKAKIAPTPVSHDRTLHDLDCAMKCGERKDATTCYEMCVDSSNTARALGEDALRDELRRMGR